MGVTNVGLNYVLDAAVHGGTQVATWYIGLINNSPAPTLAAGDTLSSHAGWVETTAYSGNRQAWGNGAASSQATSNSSPLAYAMTGMVTVYGTFGASAASGTSGTLLWTAAFTGGTQAVANGDTLNITHTISAASG